MMIEPSEQGVQGSMMMGVLMDTIVAVVCSDRTITFLPLPAIVGQLLLSRGGPGAPVVCNYEELLVGGVDSTPCSSQSDGHPSTV